MHKTFENHRGDPGIGFRGNHGINAQQCGILAETYAEVNRRLGRAARVALIRLLVADIPYSKMLGPLPDDLYVEPGEISYEEASRIVAEHWDKKSRPQQLTELAARATASRRKGRGFLTGSAYTQIAAQATAVQPTER